MKRWKWGWAGLVLASMAAPAATAVTLVPFTVVVKLDNGRGELPFQDVGGFSLTRNNQAFTPATCPNASNEKGELVCKVACSDDDGDLRLRLVPPGKERAQIVVGKRAPAAQSIEIAKCKLVTKPPVAVVYETALAQLVKLKTAAPRVYNTVATVENGAIRVKPFDVTAPELERIAQDPADRQAIQELGEVARLHTEALGAGQAELGGASLKDYAVGANSVVLRAEAAQALGTTEAKRLVNVSARPAELNQSADAISRTLAKKKALNPNEIKVLNAAKSLRQAF